MTGVPARSLSVVELQGALAAAWRGEFLPGSSRPGGRSGVAAEVGGRTVARLAQGQVAAPPGGGAATRLLQSRAPGEPVAVVLPTHPGVGASSVALSLAVAVAEWGAYPQLVECATPERSGLAAASDTELGEGESGWCRGTRGRVTIYRPGLADVSGLPPLPDARATPKRRSVLILDPAWPATDLLTGARSVGELAGRAQLVLVLRASVPGVQAAERLLGQLPGLSPLVAVLGPARWHGVVAASCGALLALARDEGRVVALPVDGHLSVTGLTTDPLPRTLLAAARVLARRTFPEIPSR